MGIYILRTKSSVLSYQNFEQMVFIKGNLKIMKMNQQEEEIE